MNSMAVCMHTFHQLNVKCLIHVYSIAVRKACVLVRRDIVQVEWSSYTSLCRKGRCRTLNGIEIQGNIEDTENDCAASRWLEKTCVPSKVCMKYSKLFETLNS